MIAGKTFLNTRPYEQAAALTHALMQHGAKDVIELPSIHIAPVDFKDYDYSAFDHVIFVSQNAVLNFVSRANIAITQLKSVIAVGVATQQLLLDNGAQHCLCPTEFSSQGILALPNLQCVSHQKILIVSGENSKPLLDHALSERGAEVTTLPCYRREGIDYDMQTYLPKLQRANINTVISTSNENLVCLFKQFRSPECRQWLCEKALCVVTKNMHVTAKEFGIYYIIQSISPSVDHIIKSLA